MQLAQVHDTQTDATHREPIWNLAVTRFLAALPGAAAVLVPDGQVIEVNRALLDRLDYPPGRPAALGLADLFAATDARQLDAFIASGASETSIHLQLLDARAVGRDAWVRLARLIFEDRPEIGILLSVLELPIEEARVVAAGSGRVARETVERAPPVDEAQAFARVANWELDVTTGRIDVSHTWYDIWGFDRDAELTFNAVLERLPPSEREPIASAVRDACDSGASFRLRHRIIRADGALCWAESMGHPDPGMGTPARRLRGVVLDITQRHAAEQAIARYEDIISASPDRIAFLDRGCRVQAANAAFLAWTRGGREAVIGRPLRDVAALDPATERIYRHLGRCLDRGEPILDEWRESAADGALREYELRLLPHRDEQDQVFGIVVNIRDVTSLRESERRLRQSAAIFDATSDGIMITDAAIRIVAVNDAFTQITGYAEAELLGRKPSLLSSHWHSRGFFIRMWRRLLTTGAWEGELWNRRKDGEIYLQKLRIRRVLDQQGRVCNYLGLFAERRPAASTALRTEHFANYDPLTKLPNRSLFGSRLTYALDPTRRNRPPLALFLLDLDRFENVNTSLGHSIGDELLRAVGLRLRETIRPADTLARLCGNQFGLLFEGVRTHLEAEEIARRLRTALRDPMMIRGHQMFVTFSLGIALDGGHGGCADTLMARADAALRRVKQGGRDGFRIHLDNSEDAEGERHQLMGLLRAGLAAGELDLTFRPRIDLETGRWTSAEARVRWYQPERGLMPAERFLPMAEASGLMVELGHWMLSEACQQMVAWRAEGLPIERLVLRVAETQLTRVDLFATVERQLRAAGLDPVALELAFDESFLVKHPEQVRETFHGLRQLGVGITLCEVGTGWLAPAVLRRLPIDRLCIHRSFVEAMLESKDDLAVVQALIALAQALDIDVVADGVRVDQQRVMLLNLGCLAAQGELFTPPLAALPFAARARAAARLAAATHAEVPMPT